MQLMVTIMSMWSYPSTTQLNSLKSGSDCWRDLHTYRTENVQKLHLIVKFHTSIWNQHQKCIKQACIWSSGSWDESCGILPPPPMQPLHCKKNNILLYRKFWQHFCQQTLVKLTVNVLNTGLSCNTDEYGNLHYNLKSVIHR